MIAFSSTRGPHSGTLGLYNQVLNALELVGNVHNFENIGDDVFVASTSRPSCVNLGLISLNAYWGIASS